MNAVTTNPPDSKLGELVRATGAGEAIIAPLERDAAAARMGKRRRFHSLHLTLHNWYFIRSMHKSRCRVDN